MFINIFLELILIIFLLSLNKKDSLTLRFFIFLQAISFFLQYLVGYNVTITYKTILNILFINFNLFILTSVWAYANIQSIELKRPKYFFTFKKIIYPILFFSFLINIVFLIIILKYIPNPDDFKRLEQYKELYELFPGAGILFRFSSFTSNMGYMAIPIFFYYLNLNKTKEALKALILSLSSLIAAFATYSRAGIITYILVFIVFFLLAKNALNERLRKKINSILRKSFIIIGTLFLVITIVRFSSMEYYGDRIPKESLIKDPIIYSLVDYASQASPNGLEILENYSKDKNLKGYETLYNINQLLGFFGIISWDNVEASNRIEKAYEGKAYLFQGYIPEMVYDFGYIGTIIITFLIYFFISGKLKDRKNIYLEDLCYLVFFISVQVTSIFYNNWKQQIFPLFLIMLVQFCFTLLYGYKNKRRI